MLSRSQDPFRYKHTWQLLCIQRLRHAPALVQHLRKHSSTAGWLCSAMPGRALTSARLRVPSTPSTLRRLPWRTARCGPAKCPFLFSIKCALILFFTVNFDLLKSFRCWGVDNYLEGAFVCFLRSLALNKDGSDKPRAAWKGNLGSPFFLLLTPPGGVKDLRQTNEKGQNGDSPAYNSHENISSKIGLLGHLARHTGQLRMGPERAGVPQGAPHSSI